MSRRWLGIVAAAVLLEALARYLRLPIFPGLVPLLLWSAQDEDVPDAAAGLTVVGVGTVFLLLAKPDALLLVGAVAATAFATRRARLPAPSIVAISAVIWVAGSFVLTGLTGAWGVEVLFTAVLMQLLGSEIASGIVSRLLLICLAYGTYLVARWPLAPGRRRLGRSLPMVAGVVGMLVAAFSGISWPSTAAGHAPFTPSGEGDPYVISFQSAAVKHVELPAAGRTREVCLSCHADRGPREDIPREQWSHHQIHELECISCHTHAATPGFPERLHGEDRRTAYNQLCPACHINDGGWRQREAP